MKINKFFMILCGVLAGTNIQLYASEALVVATFVGGVATMAVVKTIKNTATYQTYSQHKNRLVQEQEESDKPWLHAQPLPITTISDEKDLEKRIAAFEEKNKKEKEIYNERLKPKVKKRHSFKIIENYDGKK